MKQEELEELNAVIRRILLSMSKDEDWSRIAVTQSGLIRINGMFSHRTLQRIAGTVQSRL